MIDPRILRDDPDRVRAAQAKRRLSDDVVDRALEADAARRRAIADFESKRAEQKASGALVANAQGEERQALLAQVKQLAAGVKEAEAARTAADEALTMATAAVDSAKTMLDSAPVGKDNRADVEMMKADLAGAETNLEQVRQAIAQEDYLGAKAQADD